MGVPSRFLPDRLHCPDHHGADHEALASEKMLRFSVLSFLKQVVLKTVSASLLICLVNCAIYLLLPDMYGKRIIFLLSTSLLSILLTYLTGLNNQEKY